MIVNFFIILHIDLNVAIEKRKNFDATIDRETISVQNIDFFDISIDKNFNTISKKIKVTNNSITNFDDVKDDEIIDWKNVKNFDSKTNKTTNY